MFFKNIPFLLLPIFFIFSAGCTKYLEKVPDKSLVIPSTLNDLQALLENWRKVNTNDPSGGEMSSDNYYLTTADWNNLDEGMRNLYVWEKGNFFPSFNNMWKNAYQTVYFANVVLDNLQSIHKTADNEAQWDRVKGSALYLRAKEFHLIALTWSLGYDSITSEKDLGIPLRLQSDFNVQSRRASVEETYTQIIKDLKESVRLLPVTPLSIYRPSKPAAYAMLARVYLSMRKYKEAGRYADSSLHLFNSLIDFSTLNFSASRPISGQNPEIMFYASAGNWGPLTNSRAKIDSSLYGLFDPDDLRQAVFFRKNNDGTVGFKGTYTGGTAQLTGPATDEVYLTIAECLAREGNISSAMDHLNALLITRWRPGTFIPFEAENKEAALELILNERRKELIYRELRWMDIKRLNKEGANIVLKRIIDGKSIILPPNDLRYALPIPEAVITVSGMEQNPR